MRSKIVLSTLAFLAVVGSVIAVIESATAWEKIFQVTFLVCMAGLFRVSTLKSNFTGFLLTVIAATLISMFKGWWFFSELTLGLWLSAFVFLLMEAFKFTKYNRRNRYLHLYFFVVVGIYTYLFSLHILEIRENLTNELLSSMYLIYYLNLLILGITALVYYLNSFSKKAVFFSCLALAFILSDVLRDMGSFYFRDLSVEIAGTIIKVAGISLSFLFFTTKEKKLRLLNLV